MPHYALLALIVLAGTGGELCVSRAMKEAGEPFHLHPSAILKTIFAALRTPWMWLGIGMMATAFFALLGALSVYNVSFVVPVTALSYVFGALGSTLFLREQVTRGRWLGILMVAFGVTLVFLGKS